MWFKPVTLHKKSKGFTLIEMMIAVAVMAIAMGLAAPSLTNFIKNNRMTADSNKLVSALTLARNEAVSRRVPVVVSLQTTGWVVNVGGTQIAAYKLENDTVLQLGGTTAVTFTPDGFRDLSATPSLFTVKICSQNIDSTREVTVSVAGTTSVKKETGGC